MRIVESLKVSKEHTKEVPWVLPFLFQERETCMNTPNTSGFTDVIFVCCALSEIDLAVSKRLTVWHVMEIQIDAIWTNLLNRSFSKAFALFWMHLAVLIGAVHLYTDNIVKAEFENNVNQQQHYSLWRIHFIARRLCIKCQCFDQQQNILTIRFTLISSFDNVFEWTVNHLLNIVFTLGHCSDGFMIIFQF